MQYGVHSLFITLLAAASWRPALVGQALSFSERFGFSPYLLLIPLVAGVYSVVRFTLAGVETSRWPVSTGKEAMIGEVGVVRHRVSSRSDGMVFVHGELWKAYQEDPEAGSLERGAEVEVVGFRDAAVVVRAVRGGN